MFVFSGRAHGPSVSICPPGCGEFTRIISDSRWFVPVFGLAITRRTHSHDGFRFLQASSVIVSQVLHRDSIVIVRARRGAGRMLAPTQYGIGELLAWCRGSGADSVPQFALVARDVARVFGAKCVVIELE